MLRGKKPNHYLRRRSIININGYYPHRYNSTMSNQIFFNVFYCDAAMSRGLYFQYSATPQVVGLFEFDNIVGKTLGYFLDLFLESLNPILLSGIVSGLLVVVISGIL